MVSTVANSNKAVVRRFWEELWNRHRLDAVEDLVTADTKGYVAGKLEIEGIEGQRQFAIMFLTAFPDMHFVIDDELAEGDTVAVRWTVTATHRGVFQGIPPSGKKVRLTGTSIMRVREGKVGDNWTDFDALGMLQQIGALPTPENSGSAGTAP